MLICEGEFYINRHSVGPFKVYLALDSANEIDENIKVVDLTKDTTLFLTSETVIPYEGTLEGELLNSARKYNY